MSTVIRTAADIPAAPFYVTCTDTFMSGWGPAAGRINRCILPCDSIKEAEIVASNARGRSDQKNVRICATKPRLKSWHLTSLFDRRDAALWYTPGSW